VHSELLLLNNWRKHKEDRHAFARTWRVDPYSTGALFNGWKELENATVFWPVRETYDPLVVYLPKTWLLREGWRRHGLIRTDEAPSAHKAQPLTPSRSPKLERRHIAGPHRRSA
jgi:hypothetical protein